MPILTEADPPRKRRHRWRIVLAMVILPLAGVFVWSWFQPVVINFGGWDDTDNKSRMSIGFGYHSFREAPSLRGCNTFLVTPLDATIAVSLPGGVYIGGWDFH